jgi:uncharacterized protein YkwD
MITFVIHSSRNGNPNRDTVTHFSHNVHAVKRTYGRVSVMSLKHWVISVATGVVVTFTGVTTIVSPAQGLTIENNFPTERTVSDGNHDNVGDYTNITGGNVAFVGESSKSRNTHNTVYVVKLANLLTADYYKTYLTMKTGKTWHTKGTKLAIDVWGNETVEDLNVTAKDYTHPAGVTKIVTPKKNAKFIVDVTTATNGDTTGSITVRVRFLNNPPRRDGKRTQIEVRNLWSSRKPFVSPSVTGDPTPTVGISDTTMEAKVVELINTTRVTGYTCTDGVAFAPTNPLTVNPLLASAAKKHVTWAGSTGTLSHVGADGSTFWDRIVREGYPATSGGENIVKGAMTAKVAVDAWLASPGHCHNLMNSTFTETGVGYYPPTPNVPCSAFFVQVFATPKP